MTIAATSLFDVQGRGALEGAAAWIEGALLGSVATAVAVVAIAWLGFLMLDGRLPLRRAGMVLLGCFILFGAGTIARALLVFADRSVTTTRVSAPAIKVLPPLGNSSHTDNDVPSADDIADPYAN